MAIRKTGKEILTNKTCKQISDLVLGYWRDELSPSTRRDFERHLSVCPDCVSFLNTYKKTVGAAHSIEPEKMPHKVRANILRFLRKQLRSFGPILLYCLLEVIA